MMSDEAEKRPTTETAHLAAGTHTAHASDVRWLARIIAERLRAARLAAGITQQELAGTRFSKSYISAIERAKMIPSFQALGILAERLGVPLSYLLGEGEVDLGFLAARHAEWQVLSERERAIRAEAALRQMSEAEALIRQDQPHAALKCLGKSDEPPPELPLQQHSTWYWLAGWALTLTRRQQDAIQVLKHGLRLAESHLAVAPRTLQAPLVQQVERLRCFLGVAYCASGQAELALEYHRQGLTAIGQQAITDPELKVLIYKGLGNEYLVLGRYQEAISYYQEALKYAKDLDNLRQHGLLYWGLGVAYQEYGDLYHAQINYSLALDAVGSQENWRLAAQIRILLGEVLTQLEQYEQAEVQLRKGLEGAQRLHDGHTAGTALGDLATLYLARGKVADAIQTAREGLAQVRQSQDPQTEGQLHLTLAAAYAATCDPAAAEQAFQEAIALLEQIQVVDLLAQAHEHYGEFLTEVGRFQDAYEQMRVAHLLTTR